MPRPCTTPLSLLGLMIFAATAQADAPAPPRPSRQPPTGSTPPRVPRGPSCLGRWQGWGHNDGPEWSIDMVVTAENGARCGTIEYPSLGCGGHLVACRRVGDTVTWTEVYTHNPGTCAPAGRIDGRCTGGEMSWTWTGAEVVRSTLTRTAPAG